MSVNSKQKGARYERELALAFRDEGYHDARRGQQYSGANGDADSDGVRYFVRLGEVVYWRPIDSRVIDATKE